MTRLALGMLGALTAFSVNAQYDGPAVETCRAYAKREMAREGTGGKDVVIERDQALSIERYTRKLGNQFVSSILRGNGAVVLDNAPSAELAFICLLADDKRAVFFEWLPRPDASARCGGVETAGWRTAPGPTAPRPRPLGSRPRRRRVGRADLALRHLPLPA